MGSEPSFQNVKSKWFPEISHHCPGTPIVLVGTKSDLRGDMSISPESPRVSTTAAQALAKDIGAVRELECSALTQEGLKTVFDEAIRAVDNNKTVSQKKKGCAIL